jgi:hypothetical protein
MGLMTLEQMTSEVSLNLAGVQTDPTRLTQWVNWGYINLGSYQIFPELQTTAPFYVFTGVTTYPLPDSLLGIVTIELYDQDDSSLNSVKLQIMRRPFPTRSQAAQPTHFKQHESNILVWPEPDVDYEGYIEFVKVVTALSATTDKSIFSAPWDVAIVMLATHHALLSLAKPDEADRWLGRFLGYVASRRKAIDVQADMPRGGINVAWDRSDIQGIPSDLEE